MRRSRRTFVFRQFRQRDFGAGKRDRVPIEGTAVRNAASEHQIENLFAACNRTDRDAGSQSFTECRKIWSNAIVGLRPTDRPAEASDHFVKDKQGTVPVANRAQLIQISRRGKKTPAVTQHRLGNDRRDFVAVFSP